MKMNMKRGLSAAMTLVMLACGACPALAEDKKETVFVMADATGETDHIVVSERLYNADGSDVLTDVSALDNIENVGGCTMCHPEDYYSHRGTKGNRGSLACVIMNRRGQI